MKDLQIFNQLPGLIGWKDCNSIHLGCNHNLAAMLEFKKTTDIIGLKDQDIPSYTEESILFHAKNDQFVLSGKTVKGLHKASSPFNGEVFYFVKKPLFNKKNQICGLIYHCHEFNFTNSLFHQFEKNSQSAPTEMMSSNYYIDPAENHFGLSQRELECLFLVLRGKSAKETGLIMGLSKRTVESYLENIKNKFGCSTKTDLIVTAMASGYQQYIPSRFINTHYS